MYNYAGILYRAWGVSGFFVLLGVCCLLLSKIRTLRFDKECLLAAVLCIVWGVLSGAYYIFCYMNPQVKSIQATFIEERAKSRAGLTNKFRFYNEEGSNLFYLDVLSKKTVLGEILEKDKEYIIYYESRTKIIVGAETVE